MARDTAGEHDAGYVIGRVAAYDPDERAVFAAAVAEDYAFGVSGLHDLFDVCGALFKLFRVVSHFSLPFSGIL